MVESMLVETPSFDEIDDDGDGYVECNASLQNWFGPEIEGGDDCDDNETLCHPQWH